MLGSYHKRYYHPDQFLLLSSEAGASHGGSTGCLLVGRGEAGSNPDELMRQLILYLSN